MKKILIILFIPVTFISCDKTNKELKQRIAGADSVAINYFKGDGTMDTITAVKIIRDKKSIDEITGLITGNSASVKQECGYNGSLHFFKNDKVVQDIFFSGDSCSQFYFRLNGKDAASALNDKAKDFLLTHNKE